MVGSKKVSKSISHEFKVKRLNITNAPSGALTLDPVIGQLPVPQSQRRIRPEVVRRIEPSAAAPGLFVDHQS
jgi:hypothetical protein